MGTGKDIVSLKQFIQFIPQGENSQERILAK